MSDWAAKRFWKNAAVKPEAAGFAIELDGRRVRTPAKAELVLPTRAMAEAVAAEWQAQGDVIAPLTMPVTRSANAALDKVRPQHREVADMLTGYGDSDLLCYRADTPEELVLRQAAEWDPPLDWAADELNVRLAVHRGVMHRPQEPENLARLGARVQALSPFQMAAFHDLVSLSGSLILGLAAVADWRPADTLWEVSRLDEIWQEEQWGQDDEAQAMAALKRAAFLHAKRFFDLS